MTLTFDFPTPKYHQHIYECEYICDQNLVKLPLGLFLWEIWYRLPAVTLTLDLLTPKVNEHIYGPKYMCDQNWVKFPSLAFEIWYIHNVCGTHRLTHSQTERPENSMPPAPFFNGGGGIITTLPSFDPFSPPIDNIRVMLIVWRLRLNRD